MGLTKRCNYLVDTKEMNAEEPQSSLDGLGTLKEDMSKNVTFRDCKA